ncbi:MAG: FtsX-like permease family protein [Porphyromonas sp.]|nr:FtsX-like permease family protein [Porphyromonas sp.]
MSYLTSLFSARFIQKADRRGLSSIALLSAIGIALGLGVILLSGFIISGFKRELKSKLIGVTGSVQLLSAQNAYSQNTVPFKVPQDVFSMLSTKAADLDGYATGFCTHTGIIKTDSSYVGVAFMGVDRFFVSEPFYRYSRPRDVEKELRESEYPVLSLSSRTLAKLNKQEGDTIRAFFHTDMGFKVRPFRLLEGFDTGLPDFDGSFGLTQIDVIRGVLAWKQDSYGGIKIVASSAYNGSDVEAHVYDTALAQIAQKGESISLLRAEDLNPVMFGWLQILDTNILIIFSLLIFVAGTTMVSGIIVLILDKVQAISTLKAIGMKNRTLQKIFHTVGLRIILLGLLCGNIFALLLAFIQNRYTILTLDSTQYYMSYVPVEISWYNLILPNVISFVVLYLVVYLPTTIIINIKPSKGIRFD